MDIEIQTLDICTHGYRFGKWQSIPQCSIIFSKPIRWQELMAVSAVFFHISDTFTTCSSSNAILVNSVLGDIIMISTVKDHCYSLRIIVQNSYNIAMQRYYFYKAFMPQISYYMFFSKGLQANHQKVCNLFTFTMCNIDFA